MLTSFSLASSCRCEQQICREDADPGAAAGGRKALRHVAMHHAVLTATEMQGLEACALELNSYMH